MATPTPTDPYWLLEARRRDSGISDYALPSQGASYDRKQLLKAYDEQAGRLSELESQLAALKARAIGLVQRNRGTYAWARDMARTDEKWQATFTKLFDQEKARAEKAEADLATARQELGEQEVQMLSLVQANLGLGELLGDVLHDLKEAWAQADWTNIAHLIEHLKEKAGPAPSPKLGSGAGEPVIELRADRVGFDSPEYAARIEGVRRDVESLKSKNPNRPDRPSEPWRAVFPTQADYDASVESAVSRIQSGEIQPRESETEQGRIDCPGCGESLAWDNAWAGTGSTCKYCGYPGEPEQAESQPAAPLLVEKGASDEA